MLKTLSLSLSAPSVGGARRLAGDEGERKGGGPRGRETGEEPLACGPLPLLRLVPPSRSTALLSSFLALFHLLLPLFFPSPFPPPLHSLTCLLLALLSPLLSLSLCSNQPNPFPPSSSCSRLIPVAVGVAPPPPRALVSPRLVFLRFSSLGLPSVGQTPCRLPGVRFGGGEFGARRRGGRAGFAKGGAGRAEKGKERNCGGQAGASGESAWLLAPFWFGLVWFGLASGHSIQFPGEPGAFGRRGDPAVRCGCGAAGTRGGGGGGVSAPALAM